MPGNPNQPKVEEAGKKLKEEYGPKIMDQAIGQVVEVDATNNAVNPNMKQKSEAPGLARRRSARSGAPSLKLIERIQSGQVTFPGYQKPLLSKKKASKAKHDPSKDKKSDESICQKDKAAAVIGEAVALAVDIAPPDVTNQVAAPSNSASNVNAQPAPIRRSPPAINYMDFLTNYSGDEKKKDPFFPQHGTGPTLPPIYEEYLFGIRRADEIEDLFKVPI